MSFRVELDTYRGPLDLLLYLVRRQEVPITRVRLGELADQYLAYLEVLKALDLDGVSEFLDVAGQLLEIKARAVLPREEEAAGAAEATGEDLVQRLLEYRAYREAAVTLDEVAQRWQARVPRLADDVPRTPLDPATQPIREVELWDLVSAVTRILREARAIEPPNVVYDETPLDVYVARIRDRIAGGQRVAFSELLKLGTHKSAVIGVFLALLELVRHHEVAIEQPDDYGEIWVTGGAPREEASAAQAEPGSDATDTETTDTETHGGEPEDDGGRLSPDAPEGA